MISGLVGSRAEWELRLLGPVEAYVGDRRIELGPRKSRFILAVLALEANQLVSLDRLIDLTWPVSPPRTAANAVMVCISQSRKMLSEAACGVVLVRQGNAYALRTDPLRVDVHRFRALVAQAQDVPDEERVGLLDRALDLWHGPALEGAAPAEIRATLCHGLEEARLVAIEDRLAAKLRLGSHRELIGELTRLVAANPLREHIVAQYMLALHRCGRTSDALAVYQTTRQHLATELGLDPGPELQSLQSAILRGDQYTAAPQPPATEVPPQSPVRVVIVDDHPLFRSGVCLALESAGDIEVVGEAGDVDDAFDVIRRTAPDVVIMDLHLPSGSGVQVTRMLAAEHPATGVLVMTMSEADDAIVGALRAGARGYLVKGTGRAEVLQAVRTVARGSSVFSRGVASRLAALAAAP